MAKQVNVSLLEYDGPGDFDYCQLSMMPRIGESIQLKGQVFKVKDVRILESFAIEVNPKDGPSFLWLDAILFVEKI